MPRPRKKSGVTISQRKEWLRRFEEYGDSIEDLVKKSTYERRTVSKHLELARQEREAREARLVVLRDAIQSHYGELVQVAEKMQAEVGRGSSVAHILSDRKGAALRKHLAQADVWRQLGTWERTHARIQQGQDQFHARIASDLKSDKTLAKAFIGGEPDYEGTTRLFTEQSEIWRRGGKGLDVDADFSVEAVEDGLASVKVGGYLIGKAHAEQVETIKKALMKHRVKLEKMPDYVLVKELEADLDKQMPAIDEGLAVIIMRRVLPGRCKYCPA